MTWQIVSDKEWQSIRYSLINLETLTVSCLSLSASVDLCSGDSSIRRQYVASTACHHNTSKLMVSTAPPARPSPLSPKPVGFNCDREADIPLDNALGESQYQDLKKKERELQA
ncbi:secretory carrier-associated membrane protein 3 [Corchorus capsularis]|uniref:Secretory carrier-associated membrane protein 3 n=1 Tax=Corchorus capsularis TaxID=210143 RepID=A0A1R3FYH0_COCAP|nr:secretory carrier-associated membrane protein 3 [Corchorus capsularis]